MHLIAWPTLSASAILRWPAITCVLLFLTSVTSVRGMTDDTVLELRHDTKQLFYHGFDNYLAHAFPEDELKPISCKPQTRNRDNPADIGLNDVLGNYSLTLIDSLSTLAILASGGSKKDKRNPLRDFQNGVRSLVDLYGDGTDKQPCGTRACGFDLDSKVQVFETNIRGVGGLLSAHLFAVGELPIAGYDPVWKSGKKGSVGGIKWKNGFTYSGQLLHLAYDLAQRLLPAFSTETDLPYPRVNLRHGIPFYKQPNEGVCRLDGTTSGPRELTENCAAGAGSLVLEFTTLSRLTGDMRFEKLAKRAFWAIWNRRSSIDLIGNGIDSESGLWTSPPLSGIGAGIDSFFEYALKSHILLSNLPYDSEEDDIHSPDKFLEAWQRAHSAVKRHVYRSSKSEKYPFYGQADLISGAPRYSWVDNLSAYYPGLLVLAGELDEAVESHLLYTALWTRYSALPERWQVFNAFIDSNFKHWAGRPEFIESTFHLYQATKDPYYLHVGEMAIRDIRRRCWTKCGWADLRDVNTGEQRDRMESFFLGETAKYFYLLFTEDHPLNKLDRPVVFSTEGHPLVIPDTFRTSDDDYAELKSAIHTMDRHSNTPAAVCSAPPNALPLTISNTANRADLFHAAALVQLHLVPVQPVRASPLTKASPNGPAISVADIRSPTNYTFYPWTLPKTLIPTNGHSSAIIQPIISSLTFPTLGRANSLETDRGIIPMGALQKMLDGILVNSLSNLRFNMIQESKSHMAFDDNGIPVDEVVKSNEYRIHEIANWALGKDEKVLLTNEALQGVSPTDPHFTRIKDREMIDILVDVPVMSGSTPSNAAAGDETADANVDSTENDTIDVLWNDLQVLFSGLLNGYGSSSQSSDKVHDSSITSKSTTSPTSTLFRQLIPAILPTGVGAAPLPYAMDGEPVPIALGRLPFNRIFFLDSQLCHNQLPASIAKSYHILAIRRGGCSFNDKLANIPSFLPTSNALQLVIVLSPPDDLAQPSSRQHSDLGHNDGLIRPLLDEPQLTPNGIERRYPIAMVMVNASDAHVNALKLASTALGFFDEHGNLKEIQKAGSVGANGDIVHVGTGLAIKRRYWFESMGIPIGNLLML